MMMSFSERRMTPSVFARTFARVHALESKLRLAKTLENSDGEF